MKRNKKIIIAVLVSIFVVTAIIVIAKKIVSSGKNSNEFYTVRTETYENSIQIAGTISAAKSQTLKAKNDGSVVGVYKKEGDVVKEGDLIVQLDETEQLYNLANLDYEISVARQNQTSGKINLMLTQRKSLLRKIEDRKIVATFDGTIASLDVDPGDYLEAKDSIGTLVDSSYLTAEVEIAETDVSKLKVGQKVDFKFPACSKSVEGYLLSFPAIGEVTSRGATVVKAKVRIDNVPKEVLPNFSFTGKIQITEPEAKVIVERYAIGYDKGSSFVEIVSKNGGAKKVEVEVRPYGTDYVEIISGLNGGETLKAQSSPAKSGRMSSFKKSGMGGMSGSKAGGNRPAGGMPPF